MAVRNSPLTPEPLGELEQWVKEIGVKWDERLLRLKKMLEEGAD
jgi:hypothetical protein